MSTDQNRFAAEALIPRRECWNRFYLFVTAAFPNLHNVARQYTSTEIVPTPSWTSAMWKYFPNNVQQRILRPVLHELYDKRRNRSVKEETLCTSLPPSILSHCSVQQTEVPSKLSAPLWQSRRQSLWSAMDSQNSLSLQSGTP